MSKKRIKGYTFNYYQKTDGVWKIFSIGHNKLPTAFIPFHIADMAVNPSVYATEDELLDAIQEAVNDNE